MVNMYTPLQLALMFHWRQSVTFLVSKPKCQSQECDIFGFDTGFETKMSFSAISHGHHLRHLFIPPLMKTYFSSKIGKYTTAQPKIRPCLSFFGMTGSGDLLKFRFSKSSYSLSSKMAQDGQETPVTTRGKTGFIFLFSNLLQEKTTFATICICICETPLARKKAICISIWM